MGAKAKKIAGSVLTAVPGENPYLTTANKQKHHLQSVTPLYWRKMRYKLPTGLTCKECTLQWFWLTGNNCQGDAKSKQWFDDLHKKYPEENLDKWSWAALRL